MKINDVITEKAILENLGYRKKVLKEDMPAEASSTPEIKNDFFNSTKKVPSDLIKIKQLQKNFLRDNASLKGLYELQEKVHEFESSPNPTKDYGSLTRELNAIVNSVKYNGENIISYLSTNIQDNKSLYTFKSNLELEINNIKSKIAEERKTIAFYLVKEENIAGIKEFSSENAIRSVLESLNKTNVHSIHKGVSNLAILLGVEK